MESQRVVEVVNRKSWMILVFVFVLISIYRHVTPRYRVNATRASFNEHDQDDDHALKAITIPINVHPKNAA